MPLSAQLHDRQDFEKRTLRALAGAGVLAGLAVMCRQVHLPVNPVWMALLGAGMGAAPGGWKARLAVGVGLLVTLDLPGLFRLPSPLAPFCMGVIAASAVDFGRVTRMPLRVLAGVLGAGALVPLALYVKRVMDARLFDNHPGTPGLVLAMGVVALFWSVGRLASHVTVHDHPVEARGEAVENRLTGEVRALVARARRLHKECRREAGRLAAGPGRMELLGVLDRLATGAFALAEEYTELTTRLEDARGAEVDTQVKELRARAATMTDSVARRQLELAASSLGEELNHLDVLSRKRERLLARLHAQVAMVERARVSFVGVHGGELAAKGEQAARLAQRLSELEQGDTGASTSPSVPLSSRG